MTPELQTKLAISVLPATYFIWTGQFTGACLILFFLVIIDTITGLRKACIKKEFSTQVLKDKVGRKSANYLTYLITGYLIHVFIINIQADGWIADFFVSLLGSLINCTFIGFIAFLIGGEIMSIFENLAILGQPLPKEIMKKINKDIK